MIGNFAGKSPAVLTALAALVTVAAQGCGAPIANSFDSSAYVRTQIEQRAGAEVAAQIDVPFTIDDEMRLAFRRFSRIGSDDERLAALLDFIFHQVQLTYEQAPTRDALAAYRSRKANCLSFVNLFVGMARDIRLAPFYVEVTDYQHWNHRQGMVISQGHIVAGMNLHGGLKTYDFLPYQEKAYRNFHPVDDMTAVAHYYNNLAAEALMDGKLDDAQRLAILATRIAPRFPNALNNLGVCLARSGNLAGALEKYQAALAGSPGNSMVLTNIMHVYQEQGRTADAEAIEKQVEESNTSNPFFYIYLGEMALARGDTAKAMDHMVHALRLQSDLAEVQLGLVKVYLAQGDLEKARHFLKRALELDATDKEAQRYATLLGSR